MTALIATLPTTAHVLMAGTGRTIRPGADRHAPIYLVKSLGAGHYTASRA